MDNSNLRAVFSDSRTTLSTHENVGQARSEIFHSMFPASPTTNTFRVFDVTFNKSWFIQSPVPPTISVVHFVQHEQGANERAPECTLCDILGAKRT